MMKLKYFFLFILMFFPLRIKLFFYRVFFRYDIHVSAKIGISFIGARDVSIASNTVIGHFNIIKSLDTLQMEEGSIIANFNWITGFPTNTNSPHFGHQSDRSASLILMRQCAITSRHMIDCTNTITIGEFSTIAGFRSQFLTHSLDVKNCFQDSKPITIGKYCFIGTQSVFLPGSVIPDYSIVAACSMVKDKFDLPYSVYAGNPAIKVNKNLITEYKYFSRERGYVN